MTKSILYGPSPLVVARCEVKQPGDFEMKALDRMRGAPGVVQSYAHIKRSPKRCALFLQYYKHGTLRRVEKGVLQIPFSNIVLIMSELLDGLKTIHERGYFHGDIKPLNVFLDKREGAIHAVLGDFGFAWKYEQLSSTSYRIQTASGEVRICSAEEADKKRGRDLYKLGKMFYLMLLPDEYRKNPLNPDCSEMVVNNLVGEKKEAALLTFELINKGQSRGITLEEALAKVTTLAKRMGL